VDKLKSCCRGGTYQVYEQFVSCGSLGLARGCSVAVTVTGLRLGGAAESGSYPGTQPFICYCLCHLIVKLFNSN